MTQAIRIAWQTYLAPLLALRALRIGVPVCALAVAIITVSRVAGILSSQALVAVQHFVILPGLPIAAALLGEMALRDGIAQRTLLYPLLGPVPRATLAAVRTAATGLLLALAAVCITLLFKALAGGPWEVLPREFVALLLGALAYTGLAGIVHLVAARGLIVNLALFAIFDYPLGRLPIGLRILAPSHHLRVLADLHDPLPIPISVPVPDADPFVSMLALLVVAGAATLAGAAIFANKNLADLC